MSLTESPERCLQRCRPYFVSIASLNAEMKPVLLLPQETQAPSGNDLAISRRQSVWRITCAYKWKHSMWLLCSKSIKTSTTAYSPEFITSLYYFYCNSSQRHLLEVGAMLRNTLPKHMGKRDILLGCLVICVKTSCNRWVRSFTQFLTPPFFFVEPVQITIACSKTVFPAKPE